MKRFILLLALAAFVLPTAASADLPADVQAAIAKMGHVNDVAATGKLFSNMHKPVPADIKVSRDLAYGRDPLQKLDVFTSAQGTGKPMLIFVHGGGFTGGDKHGGSSFAYDNIMVWAVKNGMVGAQINYRLAPKNVYPDANDDIADAIFYVRNHAKDYGGDPEKVIVWGHSAGASLVGFFLAQPVWVYRSGGTIAGAIMSSGGYEFKSKNPYLGSDPELLAQRSSLEGLELTSVPLFFTRAEWDPPNQMEQGDMINQVLCSDGLCPGFHLMKGHNHMSQVYSVGTSETQLTDLLLPWIAKNTIIGSQ